MSIVDACAKSRDWKQTVAWHAARAMNGGGPLVCPIRLDCKFVLPRPKRHLRADGTVKPSAPIWHTSRPDRTKLLRAVEDALTGVVWRDDAQVVDGRIVKVYGETPGVHISVSPVEDTFDK